LFVAMRRMSKVLLTGLFQRIPQMHFALRYFHSSPMLNAEPLKKKKRIDPAIIRGRLERKKKKIEKSIRLLLKQSKKLKPIEELTVENKVKDNIHRRKHYIRPKK
ncbi:hypothetical protein D917_08496, partial [Trichinella nativa]